MKQEMQILILDDVFTDAEMITYTLAEGGIFFTWKYVSDEASFIRSLEDQKLDIILSDYSLPYFDGMSALKIANEKRPEVPFIFVSGALGEEMAIELLKQGATDYVLKSRLSRLVPAVLRALREVMERKERKLAEDALKDSEMHYRTIFENTGTATIIVKEDMTILLANKQFEELTGFSRSDIEDKKKWGEFVYRDDPFEIREFDRGNEWHFKTLLNNHEFRIVNHNGDIINVLGSIAPIPSTKRKVLSLLDITRLKRVEREKREAWLYARRLIESSLDLLVTINPKGKIMDVNPATELAIGLSRDMLIGTDFINYFTEPVRARQGYLDVFEKGIIRDYPLAIRHVSGRVTDMLYNLTLYRDETGNIQGIFATARDITERLEAEKKILSNNAMLRTLTSELVMTEERERRRIAIELHDTVGHALALAKIKLDTLQDHGLYPSITKSIQELAEIVDKSIQQTRSLTGELSPSVLYELGLVEALESLAEQFHLQYGIQVVLKNDLKKRKIDTDLEILLYRCIRELLVNIVKHSKAKEAYITLQKWRENVRITVKDSGIGFESSSLDHIFKHSGGFGLFSIRERLNYVGGSFEVETRKGYGTCVHLMVPQKRQKNK